MPRFLLPISLLSVLLGASVPAAAQGESEQAEEPPPRPLLYGGKVGVNLANLVGDAVESTELRPGVVLGGYAIYRLAQSFGVSAELLLSRKGANIDLGMPGFEVDGSIELTYLELPILVRGMVPAGETELFAQAGAAFGLLVEASGDFGSDGVDISEQTELLDLGLLVGAGVGFDLGGDTLEVEARFERGLLDVVESPEEPAEQPAVYNQVFSLVAGYLF